MKLKHPKSIRDVGVFQSASQRKTLYGIVVVVLYAWVFQELYNTMGLTREEAIIQTNERKINEVQEQAEQEDDGDGFVSAVWSDEDEEAEVVDPLKKAALADPEKAATATGADDWYDEDDHPLPSAYLPSAFSCACLFTICSCHALFYLLCHWSTSFKASALYAPLDKVVPGAYVHVIPHAHRGKAALCIVTQSKRTDRLGFVFQNQKYEYVPAGEVAALQQEVVGGDADSGAIRLIRCPVDSPLLDYTSSKGLRTQDELESRLEHFGKNRLAITIPKFHEIMQQQLIAPIAVFQIFCSLLWMLDMYWQYTVFTVISIVMLESTSAFQRMKTLNQLNGMSSKPYPINVYRMSKWHLLTTEDLLPGDLISLKRKQPASNTAVIPAVPAPGAPAPGTPPKPAAPASTASSDIVPCDCVLLNGSAVVNEATLTGESVPQMKDGLKCDNKADETRSLDIDGRDRLSVLFSGTTIVNVGSASDEVASSSLPKTPDGGALCYVLRTGFSSSQGELVQLIEFSQQSVSADSWEIGAALFLLLLFALAAATYVMKKGLEKGDRTTHELMLKCVIIITSVVPRQLPVQMAMAVNTALMALTKEGVFCTEPYRVPWVGKISHCLFDKTGTITTDTLVPAAVVNADADAVRITGLKKDAGLNNKVGVIQNKDSDDAERCMVKVGDTVVSVKASNLEKCTPAPAKVKNASGSVAMVLAGCNALMEVEGAGLIGDPIELAALRGVDWRYDHKTETARPGNWDAKEKKLATLTTEKAKLVPDSVQMAEANAKIQELKTLVEEDKARAESCTVQSVKIKNRFHFASLLQRMSVIADVESKTVPAYYETTYRELAEQGLRVLALAYKKFTVEQLPASPPSREWVESNLTFAGFVAFECKMRTDSPTVMLALVASDHKVAMLTGDASLTALHVAKTVGICEKDKLTLELKCENDVVEWIGAVGIDPVREPFSVAEIPTIAKKYDLMTTEASLEAAAAKHADIWREVDHIQVFARCSPQGKAKVIRSMQKFKGHQVLMCGDGGNDVGALKQAEVGLALLSGYGNNMVGAEDEAEDKKKADETAEKEVDHEAQLNQQSEDLQQKAQEAMKVRKALMATKQKELAGRQQEWIKEYLDEKAASGQQVGFMDNMAAVKHVTIRMKNEMTMYQRELTVKHGNVYDKPEEIAEAEAGLEMQMIRPGDASMAAPFTSRAPSIRSCVTLIRQGRCTLLSALQQQQIMMLECMISAYTLSALSLEGARQSERQLMASSWLIMTASLSFSYATAIKTMDPVRPLKSLFHPAIFVSILGQAAIHLTCMVIAVEMSKEAMGPEALKKVMMFHKKVRAGETVTVDDSEDPLAEIMALWSQPFMPNLLNTVTFLVETAQIIAVLFVNYKGRPWMVGVLENHPLFISIFACIGGVAFCAWEVSPEINGMLHLEKFPDDEFRWTVLSLVMASIVGTFIWDRICLAVFAPKIFGAMMKEALATRPQHLWPICKTLLKVGGGLALLGSGNIFIWGGVFWLYRKHNQMKESAKDQERIAKLQAKSSSKRITGA